MKRTVTKPYPRNFKCQFQQIKEVNAMKSLKRWQRKSKSTKYQEQSEDHKQGKIALFVWYKSQFYKEFIGSACQDIPRQISKFAKKWFIKNNVNVLSAKLQTITQLRIWGETWKTVVAITWTSEMLTEEEWAKIWRFHWKSHDGYWKEWQSSPNLTKWTNRILIVLERSDCQLFSTLWRVLVYINMDYLPTTKINLNCTTELTSQEIVAKETSLKPLLNKSKHLKKAKKNVKKDIP